MFAAREVILAGGAFNTPQLLMLSGIGGRDGLEKHGIAVRVDLPGVGQNLQDRYEVAVVNRMSFPAWKSLEGATFTSDDAQYKEWAKHRDGVYNTNGAILSVMARSGPAAFSPDLFLLRDPRSLRRLLPRLLLAARAGIRTASPGSC